MNNPTPALRRRLKSLLEMPEAESGEVDDMGVGRGIEERLMARLQAEGLLVPTQLPNQAPILVPADQPASGWSQRLAEWFSPAPRLAMALSLAMVVAVLAVVGSAGDLGFGDDADDLAQVDPLAIIALDLL